MGIEQVLGGDQTRKWKSSSAAISFGLHPNSVCVQQSFGVFRKLIAGKERNMLIGNLLDTIQQQISAFLVAFSNHECQNQAPN